MRLALLRKANSGGLGFTSNQLTKDACLLGPCPIFNIRKLTKNSAHIIDFFGLKYLAHLENVGEKNALCI